MIKTLCYFVIGALMGVSVALLTHMEEPGSCQYHKEATK